MLNKWISKKTAVNNTVSLLTRHRFYTNNSIRILHVDELQKIIKHLLTITNYKTRCRLWMFLYRLLRSSCHIYFYKHII